MSILGIGIIAAYCVAATLLVYTVSPSKIATLLALFVIWTSGLVAALLITRHRQPDHEDGPAESDAPALDNDDETVAEAKARRLRNATHA